MIECLVEYKNIPHLNQLYAGFQKLHDAKVINLKFTNSLIHPELRNKPVIKVVLDDEIVLFYDTLDGFNWTEGSVSENLEYFNNTFKCDFYFKRSHSKLLSEKVDFDVLPLGLNVCINYEANFNTSLKEQIIGFIKKRKIVIKLLKLNPNNFASDSFLHYPDLNFSHINILFSAGLWDPSSAKTEESRLQREEINNSRIQVVKRLREAFGDNFKGGIVKDNYSSSILDEEYLLPYEFTNRKYYINYMKQNTICIATTGLHNSIGWKFAEYVIASRAVISEPLHYTLPGDFKKNQNYLEFKTTDDLIDNINYLLKNKNALRDMMHSNYSYYYHNLRPDILIYNTLQEAFKKVDKI